MCCSVVNYYYYYNISPNILGDVIRFNAFLMYISTLILMYLIVTKMIIMHNYEFSNKSNAHSIKFHLHLI